MERKIVQVFYGAGKGKTSAAVGQCIRAASLGQSVIIIQFLKGNDAEEFNFLEKLEPDIKLFRFEKEKESYDALLASKQKEERQNILNGFNFAFFIHNSYTSSSIYVNSSILVGTLPSSCSFTQ